MTDAIFDKTDKGREEIATRKCGLAPRLRPLLVMVDGKQSAADLLKKVAGIGLNEESISELLNKGFIQAVSASGIPIVDAAEAEETTATGALPDEQSQFDAIYRFYTETIKSTIGLRGYALQLSVEKAASVDDFRSLRQPYVDAVLKAKGNEVARSLGNRLDRLLFAENLPSDPMPQMNTRAAE